VRTSSGVRFTNKIVILSEAKDLLFVRVRKMQILRFAQDDNLLF